MKGGIIVAKKYNRSRPQKRNVDQQKLDKAQIEASRELSLEAPDKRSSRGPSIDINLRHEHDR